MLGPTINHQWRVTKYNPNLRDENGYYTVVEEWTCPSEIGKIINGSEFTIEEYLRIETAYIDTVIKFLNESKLRSLHLNTFLQVNIKDSCLYNEAVLPIKVMLLFLGSC